MDMVSGISVVVFCFGSGDCCFCCFVSLGGGAIAVVVAVAVAVAVVVVVVSIDFDTFCRLLSFRVQCGKREGEQEKRETEKGNP